MYLAIYVASWELYVPAFSFVAFVAVSDAFVCFHSPILHYLDIVSGSKFHMQLYNQYNLLNR